MSNSVVIFACCNFPVFEFSETNKTSIVARTHAFVERDNLYV